jgi:recombination protein RecT
MKVERRSFFNACMKAAQDGLLPDGREGAIVEYNDRQRGPIAQWMPMIAGIRKKVRNSGEITDWNAHVVYENDAFEFELGDDPFIKHKPALDDRGKPIAVYSIAKFKTGEVSREVMSIKEVEKVRAVSRAKDNQRGPWVQWWEEMARKTVARRHSKVLPMSTDLDDLIRRDDDLYDMEGAREEGRQEAKRPTLHAMLDQIAGTSGPVIEGTVENSYEDQQGGDAGQEADQLPDGDPAEDERGEIGQEDDEIDEDETPREQLLSRAREAAMNGPKKLKFFLGKLSAEERELLTDEALKGLEAAAARAEG